MVVTVRSLGLNGIAGYAVSAECFLSGGLPAFDIVGLPDAAVREARERVRAAVKNCGAKFPVSRITVNLAPAGQKKAGTVYDLPIFVGLLAAGRELPPPPQEAAFHRGAVPDRGAAGRAPACCPWPWRPGNAGIRQLYVPAENAAEATLAGRPHRLRRAGRGGPGAPTCGGRRPSPPPRPGSAGAGGGRPAGPAGRDGPGECEAGAGDRRGRRPQPAADRLPRRRQVHAGQAAALHPAGHEPGRRPWRSPASGPWRGWRTPGIPC